MARQLSKLARPLTADRIAAVPSGRCGTDCVEDAHPRGRGVRHLDHRAGMALIAEIDKAAARTIAFLANRVAGGQRSLLDLVIIRWPARPVLHALMPSGEEVAIHAGRFATLLDQLKLHIPGVRQRDGDVGIIIAPAPVRIASDR